MQPWQASKWLFDNPSCNCENRGLGETLQVCSAYKFMQHHQSSESHPDTTRAVLQSDWRVGWGKVRGFNYLHIFFNRQRNRARTSVEIQRPHLYCFLKCTYSVENPHYRVGFFMSGLGQRKYQLRRSWGSGSSCQKWLHGNSKCCTHVAFYSAA